MPYPILSLPYPFAKRLRQLLSPFELQDLQIAAGHNVINPLKPVVTSFKDYGVSFEGNPNAITTGQLYRISDDAPSFDSYNLINGYLYCVDKITMRDMSTTIWENMNLNNVLIKVPYIIIEHSYISNDLLKNIAKMTVKVCNLEIWICHHIDEDVTFATIIVLFPHVTTMTLTKTYFGWLNDLSSVERRLQSIFIMCDNFEKMFSFRPDELYDFVAKHGPEFRLQFYIKTNDFYLADKIKPFVDPRFQDGDFGNANFLVSIEGILPSGLYNMAYITPGSKRRYNFEETFNFQPEELYDFVAKQGPKFQLHIRVDIDDINLIDKVKQFIDPRFQLGDFTKANLIVATDNNTGPVCQTPYVVNSLKRQEKTFPKHLITKMPRNF